MKEKGSGGQEVSFDIKWCSSVFGHEKPLGLVEVVKELWFYPRWSSFYKKDEGGKWWILQCQGARRFEDPLVRMLILRQLAAEKKVFDIARGKSYDEGKES